MFLDFLCIRLALNLVKAINTDDDAPLSHKGLEHWSIPLDFHPRALINHKGI